jgi:hypothetical protein
MITLRQFIDAFGRCTSHGWLTCEEALLLVSWAELTKGPLVEIGSYQGRSAMLLAQLPADEGGLVHRLLYCIDPWDDAFSTDLNGDAIFSRFKANVASIPSAVVLPIRTRVEDWQPIPVEFVYLDGDHSPNGTRAQVKKALGCDPKVIAIHDVNDSGGGVQVQRAAVELLGPWKERLGSLAVWSLRP